MCCGSVVGSLSFFLISFFSSLAIQWCRDPRVLFSEIKRSLKPGGLFVFSSLLNGTLEELQLSWASVDEHQHVNQFLTLDDYRRAIEQSGCQIVDLEQESKGQKLLLC